MLRNYCRIHSMNLSSVLCGVVIVVAVWPWSSIASAGQSVEKPRLPRGSSTALAVPVDTCIKESCEKVDDKDIQGWDAIRMLHRQLDDDANGNVDPSESDEFLRDELKYEDNFDRHNTFHGDDNFISVDDLWSAWKNSEVYNWTVEETLDWLVNSVELPQYRDTFQNNAVDGAMLPRLAVNSQFLVTILGIKDPVHKQKIMVKAMDVVLFGAPKPSHNYVKDTALVMSLVIAVGGCWFAYIQHRYSQSHMKQMLKDMENLQKAEESLSELQEKLQQAHQQKKSVLEEKESLEEKMRDEVMAAKAEAERLHLARDNTDTELNRLRLAEEELEQVRRALRKAEYELECRSAWSAPPVLQQWLQVTHEIELMYYGMKKQAAEKQLASAKEGCEKLRKKRSTFMGSFRIAHGSSLDEVDHRIVSAKSALAEVTSDLQERLHRWGQIEQIIGLPIVNNPGLSYLTQILQTDTGSAAATPISMPSSPSSPLISANLTPMELNPHISIADCDEDLPPTYSMVTDASNQPPRYGSMKRIQPLRNVQSASCIATMPFASTSTGTVHSEIIASRPAPGKSNTMLNPNMTSSQATPSTSTSQVSPEKITSQPASSSGTHQTSQIKTADSLSADPGAISRQDKPISGNDEKTSNIKEEKKASSQDSLKRSKSAGDQKQSLKNPSKATKEQVKMSQSAGALMVSQDVKKIANSMFWVKMSQTVPDGKLMKKVRRPNSLALSQSEKNLSTMTSANVENNNAATLPSTAKKKSGWFKKHSSPTSTVQAESNEAGDSSDSFDCDDKKKKKKKKISFGKGSDKHKPTWYLQQ